MSATIKGHIHVEVEEDKWYSNVCLSKKTLVDSGQITFLNSYQIVVIILQIDPSFPFIIPLQNKHQK